MREGDALHLHRRLDAGQAAKDHRLVEVAKVADAKDATAERAEAAGDRHLKTLARDRAQGLRIDARRDLDRRHRDRAGAGFSGEEAQRAGFGPAIDGGVNRARQPRMTRMHLVEAFGGDQAERRLEPGQMRERRCAAELAIRLVAVATLPVPVEAMRRVAPRRFHCPLIGGG